MIKQALDGHFQGVQLVHMAISPRNLDRLCDLASEEDDWQPGRQGTGYFKLALKDDPEEFKAKQREWLDLLLRQLWWQLHGFAGRSPLEKDAYLLYYPSGSEIPWHRDVAPAGTRMLRANIVISNGGDGGELELITNPKLPPEYHGILPERHRIAWSFSEGSGLFFSPSQLEHRVHRVFGHRLVLSAGILVQDA